MMRIQLAKILLVLMTFSGIIMPVYAYAHELANCPDDRLTDLNNDYDSDSIEIICDHCCHFSSHSLGLMLTNTSVADLEIKNTENIHGQYYNSYKLPPPYHPPIA